MVKTLSLGPHVESLWPDGTVIHGDGWVDLEDRVRALQWHKYSTGAYRREMRRRALLWSGKTVRVTTAETLFRDLEAVGMVRLEIEGGDNADSTDGLRFT